MGFPINLAHRNFAIVDVENCRSQLRFLRNYVKCFEKTFIAYQDYYIRSALEYELNNLKKENLKKRIEISYINADSINFENKKNLADVELMFWTFKLVCELEHNKNKKKTDIYVVSEDSAFEIFTEILRLKYPNVTVKLIRGNEFFLISPNCLKEEKNIKDKTHYQFESKNILQVNPLADLCSKEYIITTKRISDGYVYTRKYKNLEKVFIKTLVKKKIIPMYVDRLDLDDTIIMNNQEHRITRIEARNLDNE